MSVHTSLEYCKKVLEQTPCGMGLFTLQEARPVFFNHAFFALLGCSEAEFWATEVEKAVPADSFSNSIAAFQAQWDIYRQNPGQSSHECLIHNAKGERRWVKLGFSTMQIEEITYVLTSFTDITTEKDSEQHALLEQQRFRLMAEEMHAAVFEWNLSDGSFYCSEAYAQYAISQVNPDDILHNRGPADIVHPDDRKQLLRFFEETRQGASRSEVTLRIKTIQGAFRWCRMIGLYYRDTAGHPTHTVGVIIDVNEEREHSFMLDRLLNTLPGGIGVFSFDGIKLHTEYYSDGFAALGGYTRSEIDALLSDGTFLREIVAPADLKRLYTELSDKVRNTQPINFVYRYICKDQSIRWVHLTASLLHETNGRPVYYCVFTNPTDETALFRSVVEDSPVGVLVAERESRTLVYANETARDIYGLPVFGVIGGSFVDYLAVRRHKPLVNAAEIAALQTDRYTEFHIEREGRYLSVKAKALIWNGVDSYILYITDETVSRERTLMADSLIDHIPGGIIVYRVGKTIDTLYFSDGIPALSGHTSEEYRQFVETGDVFQKFVLPEDIPAFKRKYDKAISAHESVDHTYRLRRKDNSIVWVQISARLIRQENDELIYYAIFTYPTKEAALYRTVADDSSTGIFIAERSNRHMIYVNSAVVKMFGSTDAHAGASINSSSPLTEKYRVMSQAEIDSLEQHKYKRFHKVWQDHYFLITAKRILWNGLDAYIMYFVDETSEHRNHEQLQSIFDRIPTGIAVYDIDDTGLRPRLFNRSILSLMKSTEQPVSKSAEYLNMDLIHPDDLPLVQNMIQKTREGKTDIIDATYRSRATGGNYIWLRLIGQVIERHPDRITVYASIADATELMQEKKKIELAEEQQREIFNTVPSGILEFTFEDHLLTVLKANRTLISMIGYTPEEFAAKERWSVADVVHPDDLLRLHEAAMSVITGKGVTYDFRLFNKQTGEYRWISCDFTVTERKNTKLHVISAFLDIEDKRRAEHANAATTQFLSRLSHDMRTPMNGILGLVGLSESETDVAVLHDSMSKIRESGTYLLGLINDTLDYQKIQSGKMTLNPEIIDTKVLVHSIIDLVKQTAESKGITFNVRYDTDIDWHIRADAMRLKQIFTNLLSNSIKYTPKGGFVELQINLLKREGTLSHNMITVRDTGIGMSKEYLQHGIFKPFSQEYSEITNLYAGSGLGLSIVKNLVDLMGGRVEVESEPGEGSTFRIYLDFERVSSEEVEHLEKEQQEERRNVTASLHSCRILLAEDHPLNAEIATRILEKSSCIVTWVDNGQKAVEAFTNSAPGTFDAILMDVRMPVMDGLEATQKIRISAHPDALRIPIIAMTANAFDSDVQNTLHAGMNAHLAKPVAAKALLQTLAAQIFKNRS